MGYQYPKAHIPWNKNKKGIHLSPRSEFKKGMTPWNKGIKTPQTSGENHPHWGGGKNFKMQNGYISAYSFNHPRSKSNRIYEHILIAEKKIGRYLRKGECVHHINGIKDDNRAENLIVLTSHAKHFKFHSGENNKKFLKLDKKKIIRLYSNSKNAVQIAKEMDVHFCNIYRRIKLWNLKRDKL